MRDHPISILDRPSRRGPGRRSLHCISTGYQHPGSSRRRSGASTAAALLYDRHAYSNPVKYIDPTGHCVVLTNDYADACYDENQGEFVPDRGDAFKNKYERSFANYMMSGDENQLDSIGDLAQEPLGLNSVIRMYNVVDSIVRGDGSAVIDDMEQSFALGTKLVAAYHLVDNSGTGLFNNLWDRASSWFSGRTSPKISSIEDIFVDPNLLDPHGTPHDLQQIIVKAQRTGNWEIGTLRRGNGWAFRELTVDGTNYTGRSVYWHPGGGHHGPEPYWKVSSGLGGTVRVGPQFGGQ